MAIKSSFKNSQYNHVVDDAYCRVENLLIIKSSGQAGEPVDKGGYYAQFVLRAYKDTNLFGEINLVSALNLHAENFVAQCYAHVKALEQFKNAVDC